MGLVKSFEVGAKVKRGRDWRSGEEDGGDGKMGRMIEGTAPDGWVTVAWVNGNVGNYRAGAEGCYGLLVSLLFAHWPDDRSGVFHRDSGVPVDVEAATRGSRR